MRELDPPRDKCNEITQCSCPEEVNRGAVRDSSENLTDIIIQY